MSTKNTEAQRLAAMRPFSGAAMIRQAVFSAVKRQAPKAVPIDELEKELKYARYILREAGKFLVRKGMVVKNDIKIKRPTKKNPEKMVDDIAIQYVDPWSTKLSKQW